MMNLLNVSAQEVELAVKGFGSNTGGGFIDQHAREYLIRNVGVTNRLDDLRNLVVAQREGQSIILRQVAEVDFAARVKRGDAGYMGSAAVIVGVQNSRRRTPSRSPSRSRLSSPRSRRRFPRASRPTSCSSGRRPSSRPPSPT